MPWIKGSKKQRQTVFPRALPCPECGKLFSNVQSLQQHRNTTHKLNKCSKCGFQCVGKYRFLLHFKQDSHLKIERKGLIDGDSFPVGLEEQLQQQNAELEQLKQQLQQNKNLEEETRKRSQEQQQIMEEETRKSQQKEEEESKKRSIEQEEESKKKSRLREKSPDPNNTFRKESNLDFVMDDVENDQPQWNTHLFVMNAINGMREDNSNFQTNSMKFQEKVLIELESLGRMVTLNFCKK